MLVSASLRRLAAAAVVAMIGLPGAYAAGTSLEGTAYDWFPTGAGPCLVIGGRDMGAPLIKLSTKGFRYAFGADNGRPCPREFMYDGPVRIYRISDMQIGPGILRIRDTEGDWWLFIKQRSNEYRIRKVKPML